jgi:hypothetical protein
MLRRTFGPQRGQIIGSWRQLHKDNRSMRLVGHVAHIGEEEKEEEIHAGLWC